MREVIHIIDGRAQLHCDNPACGHDLPEGHVTWGPHLIGYECPHCGSDMLTRSDYAGSERMFGIIRWINKWFGWLGKEYDPADDAFAEVSIHHHDGETRIKLEKGGKS